MTGTDRRRAWRFVLGIVGAWALAFLLAAVGVMPTVGGGAPLQPGGGDDGAAPAVVLVGIPGLTWESVDEETTPTLARLAEEGGTAALVLRGTHEVTCVADAWLTVGAGQRAATDAEGCRGVDPGTADDGARGPTVEEVVQDGRVDAAAWDRWRAAVERQELGTRLGTLAALAEDGGSCVAASGGAAALGAAGPDGAGPGEPASGTACRVRLVSLPAAPPSEVDAAVESVRSGLPDGTTLVVAGLGHTQGRAEAMALIVHPVAGAGGAALSSGSTRQQSLVQLADLTPTLLHLAGIEVPESGSGPLAGQPLTVQAGGGEHVRQARDVAGGVTLAKSSVVPVMGGLAAVILPLLVVAAVLRRGRLVSFVVTVAMAVPVATFLAGSLSWWRADAPVTVLTLTVAAWAVALAGLAWAGPGRRDALMPPAIVSAVTLVVLGADMMWSARLGLVSVLGLQPVTAGRFYGQGNVGFGIALGAFLVLAGALLTWVRPDPRTGERSSEGTRAGDWRSAGPLALLGGTFTVIGAAPWGGADFGGVLAVVVATGLLVMVALGLRWTATGLLGLGLLGAVVAAVVMVLDWLRGPGSRTHLGDFVQRVLDGEASAVVTRKLDQSLGILLTYPMSWFAVLALVLVAVVVLRRPAWSAPLWRYHGLYPASVAGLVAIGLGWVLNDSGIAVVALALTMVIAGALSVLGRELERT